MQAEDKGTGKSEKITITADKGRLSQEEIERMVRESEEYADEDKNIKEKIDARNKLEGYAYSMKATINDKDKLAEKIEAEDKEAIEKAVKDTITWMDEHQDASKDDYENQLKELEGVCNPIISKVYQKTGGAPGGGAGGAGGAEGGDDLPNHDEL